MVIVLSVDTGALIVAAIVTMLPFESPTIILSPPCCGPASVFRLCMNRFDTFTRFRGCLSCFAVIETDKTKLHRLGWVWKYVTQQRDGSGIFPRIWNTWKTERQCVSVNMELDVSRMPDWIQTAVDPTSRRWIEKSDGEKSSSSSSPLPYHEVHFDSHRQSSLEYHSLRDHSFMVAVVSITEQCLPKASSTPRVKQFKTRHFVAFIQSFIHFQNKAPLYYKAPS